jgi:type II secretory pathway pseudopilin PulG
MVDLLVSITVVSLLVGVSFPSISRVLESARRAESASNVRQMGLALQMYAYELSGELPASIFDDPTSDELDALEQMVFLHVTPQTVAATSERLSSSMNRAGWDGLGRLFEREYLTHPEVFYNPSHRANFTYEAYQDRWLAREGDIVGNYQFRLPDGVRHLTRVAPDRTLIADSMRSKPEYNHIVGNNMLKGDMSVSWFADVEGKLFEGLADRILDRPDASTSIESRTGVKQGWQLLDHKGVRPEPVIQGQDPALPAAAGRTD